MESVTGIAEFLAARKSTFGTRFQVFDLSKAEPMLEEMHRQYSAAGEWLLQTPLPADECVFWDGTCAVFAKQIDDKVSAVLLEAFEIQEIDAELTQKARALLDRIRKESRYEGELRKRLGDEKYSKILADAMSRADRDSDESADKYCEHCNFGQSPDGPILRTVAVFSEFCAFPIAQVQEAQVPRPTRRRLARLGVEIQVRNVHLSASRHKSYDADHSPGDRRALHFCRGHWRKSCSDRAQLVHGEPRIWIAGHWKGDPEKGIVLHNYVARIEDMNARSGLVA